MRKGMIAMVMLVGALLVTGGCAKKDLVKQDEPVTAAPAAVEQPITPAASATTPREEAAKPLQVAGETVSMKDPAIAPQEVKSALEKVFFAFDSYVLSDQSRETLVKNAGAIRSSSQKYTVEGHCDERGSDEYNLALGEKRAKAVVTYLVTLGVPADRLMAVSYGKERPADPAHTEEAWAKNRRAEFIQAK